MWSRQEVCQQSVTLPEIRKNVAGSNPASTAISSEIRRPNDVAGYMHQHLTYVLNDWKSSMSIIGEIDVMEAFNFVKVAARDRYPYFTPILWNKSGTDEDTVLKTAARKGPECDSLLFRHFKG